MSFKLSSFDSNVDLAAGNVAVQQLKPGMIVLLATISLIRKIVAGFRFYLRHLSDAQLGLAGVLVHLQDEL
jgi:hypothetical protein